MASRTIVRLLQLKDVDAKMAGAMYILLKEQHSKAFGCEVSDITDSLKTGDKIVIALDGDVLVGVGLYESKLRLVHTKRQAYYVTCRRGYNHVRIRFRILKKMKNLLGPKQYFDVVLDNDDQLLKQIHKINGEVRPKVIVRIR